MGLLDQFLSGQYSQDPDQNAAVRQGLLAAGFGLLGSKGSLSSALGQAGQAGMGAYEGAQDSQQARKLKAFQLQQMAQEAQRKTQMNQLAQQFYRAPSEPGVDATGGMETATTAPQNQAGPGGFNYDGYANAMAQYDPMQALQVRAAVQKDDTPVKLGAGETLYSGKASGFKPIAFNPKDATPTDVSKLLTEMNALPPNDPRRSIYMQAIQKATTHTPGTSVNVNTDSLGLKPKDRFEMEGKLGDDYRGAIKQDAAIATSASKIQSLLKENGALKDQAAIYSFAKMLDPEGAVREADYAAIANTAGGADKVRNLFNKALTGEYLSPNQRQDMANVAGAMGRAASTRIAKANQQYSTQARRYNLDPAAFATAPAEFPAAPPAASSVDSLVNKYRSK